MNALASLRKAWGTPVGRSLLLYVLVCALVLLLRLVPSPGQSPLAALERVAFDLSMQTLRDHWPRAVAQDAVLVGIDEGTEQAFPAPFALWHRPFAELLEALAAGGARAIAVDVVLPERSYDDILPGSDLALMRSLVRARQQAALVFAMSVDRQGRAVPIHPPFSRVITEAGLGIDRQLQDPDAVSRRFSEKALGGDRPAATLAGQLLRRLDVPPQEGLIDYSIGPTLRHVPMHEVIAWKTAGDVDRLRRAFEGRIVLVGYVLDRTDRWELPVQLFEEDNAAPGLGQPGVVTHLQTVRSHLSGGLLQPLGAWPTALLCAAGAAVVFLRGRPRTVLAVALAAVALAAAADLVAIRQWHLVLPLATLSAALLAAFAVRAAADGIEGMVERSRLKRSFAGQFSPAVMQGMLEGDLAPGIVGRPAQACVLFSDLRGFTTMSEKLPPEMIPQLLRRYFDRMVEAVHRLDGTVIAFMGDGLMVCFGAPNELPDPCRAGVQCALDMRLALAALNREFEAEGLPPLAIGIGINYGRVTSGNVGSTERHNFSTIGDPVNVASRLEGLTKDLGRPILVTRAVVDQVPRGYRFEPLGPQAVKGHTPVEVWALIGPQDADNPAPRS